MHIFSIFVQSNFVYENFPLYEELYLSIIIDICNIWYVKIMSFPIIIFQRIYFFYLLLFGFLKYFIKLGVYEKFSHSVFHEYLYKTNVRIYILPRCNWDTYFCVISTRSDESFFQSYRPWRINRPGKSRGYIFISRRNNRGAYARLKSSNAYPQYLRASSRE